MVWVEYVICFVLMRVEVSPLYCISSVVTLNVVGFNREWVLMVFLCVLYFRGVLARYNIYSLTSVTSFGVFPFSCGLSSCCFLSVFGLCGFHLYVCFFFLD